MTTHLYTALNKLIQPYVDANELAKQEAIDLKEDLARTVVASINKYVDGKRKHGGYLADRDCLVEAIQEVTDLNIYLRQDLRNRNRHVANMHTVLTKQNTALRNTLQDVANALKESQAL